MIDKYLPLGTVVQIKNVPRKLLICGFCVKNVDDNKAYDYAAYPYPTGILEQNQNVLFNHDAIEKIVFLGLRNENDKRFKENLIKSLKEDR